MSQRILFTGATGLIGRQVLSLLSQAGFEVHGVATGGGVRDERGEAADWHEADLLAEGVPAKIIRQVKPASLLHLAWSASPGAYDSVVNREWLRASQELIREFYENGGARALVAGSCFEYEWSDGVCSEQRTSKKPNTVYGTCKNSLREFTEDLCRRENFSWAWGRIFFVYGPHEHPGRFVSSVILSLLKNQTAACTHGRQIRDYLHSRDVASGLIRLLESGFVGDCNIASGQAVTLKEIAETIAGRIGRDGLLRLGAKQAPAGEPPAILADVTRLKEQVGWQPAIGLAEGLEDTINWWRQELNISAI